MATTRLLYDSVDRMSDLARKKTFLCVPLAAACPRCPSGAQFLFFLLYSKGALARPSLSAQLQVVKGGTRLLLRHPAALALRSFPFAFLTRFPTTAALPPADEGNADRAMQLRRALRRLYAALEVMEDGRDAGEEEITALTKPRRRRSRRHHQPSGLPATETPVSAAYATAHGGDSAQHGRSLAAPPREDDAISVTSDIFYDICESAEESEVCGSEAEATQGDNSLADTPHLSVATSDASQALPRTPSSRINLYKEGMELAASNDIAFRKDRTAETSCRNQQDFMARLYCVRVSTQVRAAEAKSTSSVSFFFYYYFYISPNTFT